METVALNQKRNQSVETNDWRWIITHETYADFSTSTSPALERAVIEGYSSNTVALNFFPSDSITVGVLDDPEKACDLTFCRENQILVRRRNTTGGAIYASAGSGIVCYYLRINRPEIPTSVGEAFRLILSGFAEATNRIFGIKAVYRPVNDVEVDNKKFMASSCKIEGDVLIFRNVLNIGDIDINKAVRAVPLPPEKAQDKSIKNFQGRFTCLEREANRRIRQEEIKTMTGMAVTKAFGAFQLIPGQLSPVEQKLKEEYQRSFTDDSWFYANSESYRFGTQHKGVERVEARRKAPAGLIRAVVLRRENSIIDLIITGDFHPRPHSLLKDMEDALRGAPVDPLLIRRRISQIYQKPGVEVTGVSLDDFVLTILNASM